MAYLFEYDGLNRLKQAQDLSYSSSWSLENHFETSYAYDRNGNFGFLTRKTAGTYDQPPQTFGLIDDLSYSYEGNQLMKVEDDVSGSFPDLDHFEDGSNGGNDYDYDENGNLTLDHNQEITDISYNHLNKPTEITFSSGKKIAYIYAADGSKLRQKVFDNGLDVVTSYFDYIGPVHYEKTGGTIFDPLEGRPQIAFIAHAEGRLRPVGGEMVYEYVLRDHLGNTRVTFGDLNDDEVPEILQQDHYYPGVYPGETGSLTMKTPGRLVAAPPNQYRYNGKEVQDELGLNWIDYGARMLNPMIGRFSAVDPLAMIFQSYTPYQYGLNSPIRFEEWEGKGPGDRVRIAKSYVGTPYSMDAGVNTGAEKRAGRTILSGGRVHIDCSEFVYRVLEADGLLINKGGGTANLVKDFSDSEKWIQSNSPEIGDVFLWRSQGRGHTGIVTGVIKDEEGKIINVEITHAKGKDFGTVTEVKPLGYFTQHWGWKGFYRPKNEFRPERIEKKEGETAAEWLERATNHLERAQATSVIRQRLREAKKKERQRRKSQRQNSSNED